MKTKLLIALIIGVMIISCDFYKEDVPIIIEYSLDYVPDQPILMDLSAFIDHGNSKSFRIKNSPASGTVEILAESFMLYSPEGQGVDQVTVEIFGAENSKIGEAHINLEAKPNACGVATFDYAEVHAGEELLVNLTENDLLCNPIRELILRYTPIENAEGLRITIPPLSLPPNPTEKFRIELKYNAPEGFTGTAKALYVAAMNIKEEYRDQWNTDELMINPADKFEYFVASLVEISVKK